MQRIGPATLLVVGYLGGAISMWGTYYDTAWHRTLGRDSFWSLPHLFIYGGGAVVWAAAGHPKSVFPTTFAALVTLTGGTAADVAR